MAFLAALVASGCTAPPPSAPGPFFPLSVRGGRIVDPLGRQVVLRGFQHHSLQDVDYQGREVLEGDHALVASWGVRVWRMAISWSRIEPEPGRYDEPYLAEVRQELDRAQRAGLGVILEWHHDLFARCSQAEGTGMRLLANGAPDWACPSGYRPALLSHFALFDRLWRNEDGLFDRYLAAWSHVLLRLGDHPAIAGVEPMNEPMGTGTDPERRLVFPAYRAFARRLMGQLPPGLVVLDAPVTRNENFEMGTEPLGDVHPDAVFAPHLYSGWLLLAMGVRVPPADKRRDFALALRQAQELGLPLWNGEWSVNTLLAGWEQDLQLHVRLEEEAALGSSWWGLDRHNPVGPQSSSSPFDAEGRPREDLLAVLSRPYPEQVPGRLVRFSWDAAARSLNVELEPEPTSSGTLNLFAPEERFGGCRRVERDGREVEATPLGPRLLVPVSGAAPTRVRVGPCAH